MSLLLSAYGGNRADITSLFHGAAAESVSFATVQTAAEAQYQYDNLVIRTQCVNANDTLACLRSLSAHDLQVQNYNTPGPGASDPPLYMYAPLIDNDLVPDYTYTMFAEGRFTRV